MEDDEDDEGAFEVFGIHRLELAPGTKSGYVGVRPNPSKKRPWMAGVAAGGRAAEDGRQLQEAQGCRGGQGSGKG